MVASMNPNLQSFPHSMFATICLENAFIVSRVSGKRRTCKLVSATSQHHTRCPVGLLGDQWAYSLGSLLEYNSTCFTKMESHTISISTVCTFLCFHLKTIFSVSPVINIYVHASKRKMAILGNGVKTDIQTKQQEIIPLLNGINTSSFSDDVQRIEAVTAAYALVARLETPWDFVLRTVMGQVSILKDFSNPCRPKFFLSACSWCRAQSCHGRTTLPKVACSR